MSKSALQLSICTPTLNRASFLQQNLQAIIRQDKTVEINIADNASEDDTTKVVTAFKRKYPTVRVNYLRHKEYIEFDKNVLSVLQMASGKYCWLLGDDDLPLPGSIAKIKKIIAVHSDTALIHLNYSRFDQLLRKVTARRMVGDITRDIIFTDCNKFYFLPLGDSYFKFLGTNVITMSTDILRRDWVLQSAKEAKKHVGLNFIQCFLVANTIAKHPKIYYVGTPAVQYLANNHRVWPNHIWRDYNKYFLDFLIELGFDKDSVLDMRQVQKSYEETEKLTRQPMIQYAYQLARPAISLVRYIRDRAKA